MMINPTMQQTYTYLWYCQTTNPLNIFVASKTFENSVKALICFFMYLGAVAIIYCFAALIGSLDTIEERLVFSITFSILGPLMGAFFYVLGDILIGDCLIRRCRIIMQELGGAPPVGNGPFTYLNYFQTDNPNNIFVKSQTCNDTTISLIKVLIITIFSLSCFFYSLSYCIFEPLFPRAKCDIYGDRIVFSILGTFLFTMTFLAIYFTIKGLIGCRQSIKDEIQRNTVLVLTKTPSLIINN